jgi:CheY-like chemotaxis protein
MSARRIVVLVVDDEALVRMSAVGLLDDAGYEVLEAKDADSAIALLESRADIGLVFTDVEMPGTMDGIGLANVIRARWPTILMVVASGKAEINENRLPSGARFFRKPYADNIIVAAMSKMFAAAKGLGPAAAC